MDSFAEFHEYHIPTLFLIFLVYYYIHQFKVYCIQKICEKSSKLELILVKIRNLIDFCMKSFLIICMLKLDYDVIFGDFTTSFEGEFYDPFFEFLSFFELCFNGIKGPGASTEYYQSRMSTRDVSFLSYSMIWLFLDNASAALSFETKDEENAPYDFNDPEKFGYSWIKLIKLAFFNSMILGLYAIISIAI